MGGLSVFFTDRGYGRTVDGGIITEAIDIRVVRELNASSVCEVSLPPECCFFVEPWAHEIHCVWDGSEFFVGPVNKVERSTNAYTIFSRDSLAWTMVRKARSLHDYTSTAAPPSTGIEPTAFAVELFNDALAPDDPLGTMPNIVVLDTVGTTEQRKVDPSQGHFIWSDGIEPMLGSTIDVTAHGKGILIAPLGSAFGDLGNSVMIDIAEFDEIPTLGLRGNEWASAVVSVGKTGADTSSTTPTVGYAGGASPRYGLVERKVDDRVGTDDDSTKVAERVLSRLGPKPGFAIGSDDSGFAATLLCPPEHLTPVVPPGTTMFVAFAWCGQNRARRKMRMQRALWWWSSKSYETGTVELTLQPYYDDV